LPVRAALWFDRKPLTEPQDKVAMLQISNAVSLADWEIDIVQIRSQGAGGQNVNKVASAVHLRCDVPRSALPDVYKERLLALRDRRITREGVIVIKAQRFRTFEKNKEDALQRLAELIRSAVKQDKARRPTRPTKGSQRRRVDKKTQRGKTKALRGKVEP
jgi:ribosome-associated protein